MKPLGLGQLDPTNVQAKDLHQAKTDEGESIARDPSSETLNKIYGIVSDVDDNNNVQVREMNNRGLAVGDPILGGRCIPLLHENLDVQNRWGNIRKGLKVMVEWRGTDKPNSQAVATIFASESFSFSKKQKTPNIVDVGNHKILAGGAHI